MDGDKRRNWERKWATTSEAGFKWFVDEAPAQLLATLARDDLPTGAALDIGCGSGNITFNIAERFQPTIGFDIAHQAIRVARERPRDGMHFIVAAAPQFPFPDNSFAFIFDRGCLQHVPKSLWPMYFGALDRMLVEGGIVEIMAPGERPWSKPSLRRMLTRGLRRRGEAPVSPTSRAIKDHVVRRLETEALEEFPVPLRDGTIMPFTHVLIRKAPRVPGTGREPVD